MYKIFRIDGSFEKNRQKTKFIKEMPAKSKDRALEKLYSEIGSKHAVKRNLIQINDIEEIKPEESKDPKIRALEEDE